MFTIPDFSHSKQRKRPLSLLTCYDALSAALLSQTALDAVLVGDSVAMTLYGYDSTLQADPEMIERHVQAVRRGASELCIIADLPFLVSHMSRDEALKIAGRFMRAGANAVKVEGLDGLAELIPVLVHSGIPVMGHLGLTPQAVNLLGGYRVQGKTDQQQQSLIEQARQLESLGCFSLVLECVPYDLAKKITQALRIPVIGIGAGNATDGQILVLNDLLGYSEKPYPQFVRQYAHLSQVIKQAVEGYISDVNKGVFPSMDETYTRGGKND